MTLTEMRNEMNLTQSEVGEALGRELGRDAYTHARIHQIETEGIKDADQIEALARIYGQDVSDVAAEAKLLRQQCNLFLQSA